VSVSSCRVDYGATTPGLGRAKLSPFPQVDCTLKHWDSPSGIRPTTATYRPRLWNCHDMSVAATTTSTDPKDASSCPGHTHDAGSSP
jgi:hypothetical protein